MYPYSIRKIIGIPVAGLSLATVIPTIASLVESSGKKVIFYVNSHTLNLANTDLEFKTILQKATLVFPDGMGIVLASRILNEPLPARTTIMDFIFEIFATAQERGWSIYLLGARQDVCRKAVEKLKRRFPDLIISGHHHGYFRKREEQKIVEDINRKNPTILLVGMGQPQQEKWIARNKEKLNVKLFFAVGGVFDTISGKVSRAPGWMHKNGLEWFFRLVQEPRRLWKRYLIGNTVFLFLVILVFLKKKYGWLLKEAGIND